MTDQGVAADDRLAADIGAPGSETGDVELIGRRVPRSALSSTHVAALGTHRGWLRHLFTYRDTLALVIVFLCTQMLDAGTTMYALSTGRFSEANPFLGGLVTAQPVLAYLFKVAIALFVLLALLLMRLRWRMRRIVILLFAVTSLVAPVANILRITGHL